MTADYFKTYLKAFLNQEINIHMKKDLPQMSMNFHDHGAGTSTSSFVQYPDVIDGVLSYIDDENSFATIQAIQEPGLTLEYFVNCDTILYVVRKTLTVAKLIEKLQAMPQDMEVYTCDVENGDCPVTVVQVAEITEYKDKVMYRKEII